MEEVLNMFYEEVLNMVLNKYKYVSVRGCLLIYLSTFICMYKWVCVCCMCDCRGGDVCVCMYVRGEVYVCRKCLCVCAYGCICACMFTSIYVYVNPSIYLNFF